MVEPVRHDYADVRPLLADFDLRDPPDNGGYAEAVVRPLV